MELKDLMKKKNFVVLGSYKNTEKKAYEIYEKLKSIGKNVRGISKDESLDDVDFDIEVLDICMNYHLSIEIIKNTSKHIEAAIIQPGAENEELFAFLTKKNIPYIEACALVGATLYA